MTSVLHPRFLRAALAACALLTTAGCATLGPPAAPPAWNAESPAAEITRWIRRDCRRPSRDKRCVEQNLVGLVGQAGIGRAMEVLEGLMAVDDGVRAYGHELAHGMGIAAYRSPETMAEAFAACPATQGAGCHHGIVQGYFLSLLRQGRLPGTPELDALCEPFRGSTFLYGQCGHGMGHGLMAVHDNHVPVTLDACDLATDGYIREACYGGIFMENIVLVTHPHNTTEGHGATGGHGAVDAHDAHGEHGGHGTGHGAWKALDADDPLYPCNAVAAKYQPSCYTMQTGAILYFNGADVGATGRACEGAPEAMMPICFGSLGRDIIAFADQDHARSLAMCGRVAGMADGRGSLWCTIGVVQNLVNLAADPEEGMRLCRAVTTEAHKPECYRAVGELVLSLVEGDAQRGASCRAAEPAFVAACRAGARLAPSEGEGQ